MRMLILGGGLMARGALHHYLSDPAVERVTVTDQSPTALAALRRFAAGDPRVELRELDATDDNAVRAFMKPHDAAFCAIHYGFNLRLARLAIETRTHMVDLGGNNDVVRDQLALDQEARAAGVSIVPDCGLAPGLASLLVAWGMERFDWADTVCIRVGGLPLEPQEPLRYERLFNVEGLINEYVEPPIILRDGKLVSAQPLGDVEQLDFEQPVGTLEAFNTSGGVSTLPGSFGHRLRDLDYKTLRYPGHAHAMRWLFELGLMSSEPVDVDGQPVVPRRLLAESIVREVPLCERDRAIVRVEFRGGDRYHRLEVIDEFDDVSGLTAMMRTTAFPAAIVSRMQCGGDITPGVQPGELVVDPAMFMRELLATGIEVRGLDT